MSLLRNLSFLPATGRVRSIEMAAREARLDIWPRRCMSGACTVTLPGAWKGAGLVWATSKGVAHRPLK